MMVTALEVGWKVGAMVIFWEAGFDDLGGLIDGGRSGCGIHSKAHQHPIYGGSSGYEMAVVVEVRRGDLSTPDDGRKSGYARNSKVVVGTAMDGGRSGYEVAVVVEVRWGDLSTPVDDGWQEKWLWAGIAK